MLDLIRKHSWLIVIIGVIAVFSVGPAKAYTETQGIHDTVVASTTAGASVTPSAPGISWIAPRSGEVTRICLWVEQTAGVSYTPSISILMPGSIDSTGVTWSNPGALCSTGFNSTINVIAGELYYIQIGHLAGREYNIYGSSVPNFYRVIDITTASDNIIQFTSTTTSTPDFMNWSVSFELYPTTTAYYKVAVQYGFFSNTYTEEDIFNLISYGEKTGENVGKLLSGTNVIIDDLIGLKIPKTRRLAPGELFYARAYIYKDIGDFNNIIIASSSEWEFITATGTILIQQGQSWVVPTTTDRWCDPNDGFWKSLVCPNQNLLDGFVNLKSLFENKPPFGYFKIYAGTFRDFAENSSSTTSTIPGTSESITEIDTFLGKFTPLVWARSLVGYLIWFALGFYLYYRFKHFEFH